VESLVICLETLCRHGLSFVVLTRTNTLSTQDLIQIGTTVGSSPLFDDLEHFAMDFDIPVANRRMMEGSYDVVNHLVVRDFGVIPSVDDSRCGVLKDARGYFSGRLVQDV